MLKFDNAFYLNELMFCKCFFYITTYEVKEGNWSKRGTKILKKCCYFDTKFIFFGKKAI